MGRTHALAGIASLWCLQVVPTLIRPELLAPLGVLAALGALLPDLDATESQIKRLSVAGVTSRHFRCCSTALLVIAAPCTHS